MFKNALKTSIKVLLRRKFFTFVSLFGISFTLLVLLAVTALLDQYFHPGGPEIKNDRILGAYRMRMRSPDGDSLLVSSLGYKLVDEYVRHMTTPEMVTAFSRFDEALSYVDQSKIVSHLVHTDGEYFKVFEFDFLEGRPYTVEEDREGRSVAVITEKTSRRFFGTEHSIGKDITFDGQTFTIVGVVKNLSPVLTNAYADAWVPIGSSKTSDFRENLVGDYNAILLAHSPADFPKIKEEYSDMLTKVAFPDPTEWNHLFGTADTKLEAVARITFENYDIEDPDPHLARIIAIGAAIALAFMLLPTLNLVNINISRIMERSSEIGVRKAFGAPGGALILQFLIENLVLTAIGGALGALGAVAVLSAISASGLLPFVELNLNYRVFSLGILLIVFFGALSGVYPAWRMSKLHPVQALRGGAS